MWLGLKYQIMLTLNTNILTVLGWSYTFTDIHVGSVPKEKWIMPTSSTCCTCMLKHKWQWKHNWNLAKHSHDVCAICSKSWVNHSDWCVYAKQTTWQTQFNTTHTLCNIFFTEPKESFTEQYFKVLNVWHGRCRCLLNVLQLVHWLSQLEDSRKTFKSAALLCHAMAFWKHHFPSKY